MLGGWPGQLTMPVQHVVVNGRQYGDIDAGEVSGYPHMLVAYR
jgi:hypothetical protein